MVKDKKKKKPERNELCICGSKKKYKKCCLYRKGFQLDKDGRGYEQFYDLNSIIDEIYKAFGIDRNIPLDSFARYCNIKIRNSPDWIVSLSEITHPLLWEIKREIEWRVNGIKQKSSVLQYFATCYAICKQIDDAWVKHALKKIVKIPPKSKDSVGKFYSVFAEFEQLIIFKGNNLHLIPLIESDESIPDSKLSLNRKNTGIEVYTPVTLFFNSMQKAKRLADKLILKLIKKIPGKFINLSIYEMDFDELEKDQSGLIKAIINNNEQYNLSNGELCKIDHCKLKSLDQIKCKLRAKSCFSVLIPGKPPFTPVSINVEIENGAAINIDLKRSYNRDLIEQALKKGIKTKRRKKQTKGFDKGLLMIRLPDHDFIETNNEMDAFKKMYEEFMNIAKEALKGSSAYHSIMLFSKSFKIENGRGLFILRGLLEELKEKDFNRKFYETQLTSCYSFRK